MTRWHAALAWLGGGQAVADVLLEERDGRFTAVVPGAPCPPGAQRLAGLTLPGLVDAHSHVWHRALRGRTHAAGTFWGWRERAYALAERLTPDTLLALARAAYAEAALAGTTTVAEFHYLHHDRGGRRYAEPNLLGEAVGRGGPAGRGAAHPAGHLLPGGRVRRAAGRRAAALRRRRRARPGPARAGALVERPGLRVGAAVHSVRAVPPAALPVVAAWAGERAAPLHVHVSEQPAEDAACLAATGRTPTALLERAGVLGPRTTAVHATHATAGDVALLGATGTGVCLCPTTERDLADGAGPVAALRAAGCRLSLGSDSRAVTDLLGEAAALELDERLRSGRRGTLSPADLLTAATAGGAAGWPEVGRLAAGAAADLVTVDLASVRTAGTGCPLAAAVFAATAADVRDVVVAGRRVVRDGRHLLVDDVPGALAGAVEGAWA